MSQVEKMENEASEHDTPSDTPLATITSLNKGASDGDEQPEQTNSPTPSEHPQEDEEDDDDIADEEENLAIELNRGTKRNRDDVDDEDDTQEGVIDDEDASSELGDLTSKSKEVGINLHSLSLIVYFS